MRTLDRILQRWRIAKAKPYIFSGSRVLDVGCADGALFKHLNSHIGEVVGIDPDLPHSVELDRCKLISGGFPNKCVEAELFDAITILAVLEHIPPGQQRQWAAECERLLKPGGHLIITVPSPIVDRVLTMLKFFRLIDGMSLEQHYGFKPDCVPSLFVTAHMKLAHTERFQCGFNNLFVFRKSMLNGH